MQLVLLMGECNKFNNDEAVISEFRDGVAILESAD